MNQFQEHPYLQFLHFFCNQICNFYLNTFKMHRTKNLHECPPIELQIKKTHMNWFTLRLTQCPHLTLEMQFKNFLENFARKNQGLSQIIMYILSSEDLCHIAFSRKRALQLISSGYAPNPCDTHSDLKFRIPFKNYRISFRQYPRKLIFMTSSDLETV